MPSWNWSSRLHGKFNKKVVKEEFDHNFMLLFPTFVEDFNALMTDDGKQVPTKPRLADARAAHLRAYPSGHN